MTRISLAAVSLAILTHSFGLSVALPEPQPPAESSPSGGGGGIIASIQTVLMDAIDNAIQTIVQASCAVVPGLHLLTSFLGNWMQTAGWDQSLAKTYHELTNCHMFFQTGGMARARTD
jgi:hypothetical protein